MDSMQRWQEEAALLRQALTGSAAGGRFLLEQGERVQRGLCAAGVSRGDAEDAVQEALLRLLKQAKTWQPGARIGTWLRVVSANLLRNDRRRPRPLELEETLASPPVQLEEVLAAERARRLVAAVDALPLRQRLAWLLAEHDGLAQVEVAARMGISVDAVEGLLRRARRQLRDRLGDLQKDLRDAP